MVVVRIAKYHACDMQASLAAAKAVKRQKQGKAPRVGPVLTQSTNAPAQLQQAAMPSAPAGVIKGVIRSSGKWGGPKVA